MTTRENPHRVRQVAVRIAVVLAAIWLGYLGGLCALTVVPRVIGWEPRAVLTGSMAPALPKGSVVLAASVDGADELPDGSIVVVRDDAEPGGVYVHRVVGRDDEGRLVTRGDANLIPDRRHVEPDAVVGKVRAVLPAVGLQAVWWHDRQFLPLAGFLTVSWLAAVLLLRRGVRPPAVLADPADLQASGAHAAHRDPAS